MAQRHRIDYDEEALLTPEGNIPLGVLYLRRMLRRFDGNVIYASVAYNAGPTRAKHWVAQRGDLPVDEFVESIPFDETRAYDKRVYTAYLVYRALYG